MNTAQGQRAADKISIVSNAIVSTCIFLTIVALVIFLAREIVDLFISFPTAKDRKILHDIAFLLVIVKAHRVLLSYLLNGYISIKYLVEISIIAPAIEVIFAADKHAVWLNVLFAAFSLSNLVIYIVLHEKIVHMERCERMAPKILANNDPPHGVPTYHSMDGSTADLFYTTRPPARPDMKKVTSREAVLSKE